MMLLLREIRHNPMLWLLVFVPVVCGAEHREPEAHTPVFAMTLRGPHISAT